MQALYFHRSRLIRGWKPYSGAKVQQKNDIHKFVCHFCEKCTIFKILPLHPDLHTRIPREWTDIDSNIKIPLLRLLFLSPLQARTLFPHFSAAFVSAL